MRADKFFERMERERPEFRAAVEETRHSLVIASNIIRMRKHANMAQTELAEAADVPLTVVRDMESGIDNPRLRQLVRVAQALNVTLLELLTDDRADSLALGA